MFPASVIRKLAPSEEYFAHTQTINSARVHVTGPVDVDALATAFDGLLEAHPVLGGHLEADPEGRHHIVVDDFMHPGIWIVEAGDPVPTADEVGLRLDQRQTLVNLMVSPAGEGSEITLYLHHSLGDGFHMAALLAELFTHYSDVVEGGGLGDISAEPAPESVEALLEHRGVAKLHRSGLERFLPAMFAHELPPPRTAGRAALNRPTLIPAARGRLTADETTALVEFGRANRLFLNNLVSAAVLIAEWQIRETPHIPIPYLYPVNLRPLLNPPVSATGATNALGLAAYLAQISPQTTVVDLARDIADTFAADLSDGVIAQSQLHFNLQYAEGAPGLPSLVFSTNIGRVPPIRMPAGLRIDDWETEFYQMSVVSDMYAVGVFADQLIIEHHSRDEAPEREVDLALALLRDATTRPAP